MTPYPAYLERADDGTWQAYAIELPGCVSRGVTPGAALDGLPEGIRAYYAWLAEHGETGKTMLSLRETVKAVVEVPAGERLGAPVGRGGLYSVERGPFSQSEMEALLRWAGYSRADLLSLVGALPSLTGSSSWERPGSGEAGASAQSLGI